MRCEISIGMALAAGLLAVPALAQTAPGRPTGPALAQTAPPLPTSSPSLSAVPLPKGTVTATATPPPLTVGQVIDIASALASLDAHQSGAVDRSGNPLTVPNNFVFPGGAVFAMAQDERLGREVFALYSEEVNKYRIKIAGAGHDVPKEKMDDFVRETNAMRDAPANVNLSHVKLADLCLDVGPPNCPQRNAIPMSTVSALLPIIDR